MEIKKINFDFLKDNLFVREFIDLPWKIYQDKHPWIPPSKNSIFYELSLKNLFFKHGEAQPFVCIKDGEVVGRIVASIDHNLKINESLGHFGYFESVDDIMVASELFNAASNWIKLRGKTTLHGPVDLTIYNRYRLQTNGFNTTPFLGEPRSPEYYKKLLLDSGFEKFSDWYSWDLSTDNLEKILDHSNMILKSTPNDTERLTIKEINIEKYDEEMKELHPLIIDIWKENYGFSFIDYNEFLQNYSWMKFITPKGLFLKMTGEDDSAVGFFYCYNDFSNAFAEINGSDINYENFIKNPPTKVVINAFGMCEKFRGQGSLYRLFSYSIDHILSLRTNTAIGALSKEGNSIYNVCHNPDRVYSIFSKKII